jgi:hypothetical protein
MPAKVEDRPAFFQGLTDRSTPNKPDWSVADEMLKYPDLPNHESWTPAIAQNNALFDKFRTTMDSTPNLDLDKEILKLQSDLDAAYKAAK